MDFILEVLLELILEGSLAISQNKKVPRVIRYPLIIFIIFLFLGVTFIIIFTGFLLYQKLNKIFGILLILIGIIFLIFSIIKFKKLYLIKNNNFKQE